MKRLINAFALTCMLAGYPYIGFSEDVVDVIEVTPRQLEVEMHIIAFEKSAILPEIKTGPLTGQRILELQEKKDGRLLAAPVVRTPSGQQATIKSVTEYIYPTNFEVAPLTNATGNANAVGHSIGGIVEPSGFQTREVGILFEVLPEISDDGNLIHLTLSPQLVSGPEWKNYGSSYTTSTNTAATLPMEQPFFSVVTATCSLTAPNNKFVLLAGGVPSPDGKEITYIIVRARIVDLEGNTIEDKKSNKPLQNTSQ